MESFVGFLVGGIVGYMFGVLSGRRSIAREAQELVAQAIMEVKKHARPSQPS